MAYATGGGAKFYYCVTPNNSAEDVSDYSGLVWVQLTGVESVGQFGDTAGEVTFNILDENRTRKLKGPRNAGNCQVVCAHDPLSTSQAAMVGFEKTPYTYAFKYVAADAADSNDSDSAFYFRGKVMSSPLVPGDANAPLRRNFDISIDSEVVEDLGEAVSGP